MIGKTISHYKILEKLGEGGMGVVYKAEDSKLKRPVALKFLPPELTRDPDSKKRFIQEAQAASALDHNNICTIHEINETDESQMFIAMAHYEGETLKDKIHRGPVKLEDAIDTAIQAAEGLKEAHEKNIVHRDIKPANIMMTSKRQVKIMDFGLAKLAGQTKLTKTGSTLGTASYMSPEQSRGEEVDHRSDIWSLGVILYEMITGKLPFKGDYEQAVVYSIVNEEPEPLTGIRTGVPMELERIVNKALAKNPEERYQHVDEMRVDLKSQSKVIKTGKPAQPVLKTQQSRKNRTFLFAGVLAALMLIIGFFIVLEFQKRKTQTSMEWENSIAILPCKNISSDPEQDVFCQGMTEQLISDLSLLKKIKVIAKFSVMQYQGTSKTSSEIGRELNVDNLLDWSIRKAGDLMRITAKMINTKDGSYIWAKDYDQEFRYKDTFAIQDAVCDKITSDLLTTLSSEKGEPGKASHSKNVESWNSYLLGKHFNDLYIDRRDDKTFESAKLHLEKAIALDPDYAVAYAELADLYNTSMMFVRTQEDSIEAVRLQKQYIEKALKLNPNLAEVQTSLGYMMGYLEKSREDVLKKSFLAFNKAVELNPNYANAKRALGTFFRYRGLYHQAIACFSRAVELDPLNPGFYYDRGNVYTFVGEFEKAEQDFKKGLGVDPNYLRILNVYMDLLFQLKQYDEAESLSKRIDSINPERYRMRKIKLAVARGEHEPVLEYIKSAPENRAKIRYYALLGMKEEALKLTSLIKTDMEKNFASIRNSYLRYENEPAYDILRDDVRFKDLLKILKRKYDEVERKWGKERLIEIYILLADYFKPGW